MNFNADELELEFMEQEAEDHLTEREALLLGLASDSGSDDSRTDWYAWIDLPGRLHLVGRGGAERVDTHVGRRAELLDASKILHDAALDEYQFVRDGYLQRPRNLIYDGNPPPDEDSLVPTLDNVVPER